MNNAIHRRHFLQAALAMPLAASARAEAPTPVAVWPGVEVLCEYYPDRLAGKRVGILTNPTGVDRRGVSTIDRIRALSGVTVVRLFAPEHGLRGGFQAGESVDDSKDPVSGLPVVSLHGQTRRPPAASLQGLDLMLYDIQDVGHRSYTFVSSLTYLMEACEAAGVAVWVLDRPDPLGGDCVGGPMLHAEVRSFIGVHETPSVYGLTPGEWARLIRNERTPRLELMVVQMQGWRRGMQYGELGWIWIPPSEHIPRWETSLFYAMTGTLGELGVLSEGVGTPLPFEQVGAPWIDAHGLAEALNSRRPPGVWLRPATFRPRYGSYAGEFCQGVQIHLTDARAADPAAFCILLLITLARLYPERDLFAEQQSNAYGMFLKALGDPALAKMLAQGELADIEPRIAAGLEGYRARRQKALIYREASPTQ